MNKVILIGHIGQDASIKEIGSATITEFTLATSKMVKKNDAWESVTEWHNVKAFKTGKLSDYLKKGQQVGIEGEIKTETWEKDGQKKYKTIIVANSIELIGNKPQSGQQSTKGDGEDLPF